MNEVKRCAAPGCGTVLTNPQRKICHDKACYRWRQRNFNKKYYQQRINGLRRCEAPGCKKMVGGSRRICKSPKCQKWRCAQKQAQYRIRNKQKAIVSILYSRAIKPSLLQRMRPEEIIHNWDRIRKGAGL